MGRIERIRFTNRERQKLKSANTRVYFRDVMKKLFRSKWEEHLNKLLSGDQETLDLCSKHLESNLDFFPLLHTLCLVTGRRFDLDEKDPSRAGDAWICWYRENRDRLVWDAKKELWKISEQA